MDKLLICSDVDGVLTLNKMYDANGNILGKSFSDIDFTFFKVFKSLGHEVVWLSGDKFNAKIAEKRKINFIYSAAENGEIRKNEYFDLLQTRFQVKAENIVYIGDDLFDIPLLQLVKQSFCPSTAPALVRACSKYILETLPGNGLMQEVYEKLLWSGLIEPVNGEKLILLDAKEKLL